MVFSRPVLIEHELIVTEDELYSDLGRDQSELYLSDFKDVLNGTKITVELLISAASSGGDNRVALALWCDVGSSVPGGRLRGVFSFYNKSANFVLHSSDVFFDGLEDDYMNQTFVKFGALSDLLNGEKRFIENGKITFHMKGMLFCEPSTCYSIIKNESLVDFLRARDDRDFAISVGKKDGPKTEIKIHKLILASRSPVFDRMLKTDMKENAENKLEIVDFDPKIVRAAVEYFYDQDDYKFFDVEHLINLLEFGEKYDIQDLKKRIEELLYKKLSPTNICQIANAAALLNCPRFKDICFRFMIIYIKQEIPFDHADRLDKDIAFELFKKASMPFEHLLL